MLAYVETRGWDIKKIPKTNRFTLEHRRLEEAMAAAPSGKGRFGFATNVKAMIDALHEVLTNEVLNDPFTGKGTARFLAKISFISKIDQYAQELQFALMIIKHIILPVVQTEKENIMFWTKKIFKSCRKRPQFISFCHNLIWLSNLFEKLYN